MWLSEQRTGIGSEKEKDAAGIWIVLTCERTDKLFLKSQNTFVDVLPVARK
jgi:hypothetical protein